MSETGEARDRNLVSAAGKAGGIMAISLLVSRLLGLFRDTVIASKFGLLSANDSYQIAIQIPDLIFMLIAGGGLSSAFIPVFSEFWYTDRRKEAWKVFSVVVTVCSLIAIVLIGIAWALAPTIVDRYAHGRQELVPDAVLMSRIMLPAQFAFLIGSIMLGTLYARKQFLAPSLAPNIYNVGIILGAMILPAMFGFGIIGVAWGALVGAFIGNILLPVFMIAAQGSTFRPSLDIQADGVKKFFRLLLPVILGFSLPSMVNLVSQYYASPFGPGSNTVIRYANNLMQAPLGIFGQSLALGAFPALSQFFAEERMDLYRDLIAKTLRTVLYLCIFCAVLMFATSPLIVQIIYGYGKASNDPHQLDLISTSLRIYCLAIPAWCMQPVLMRGFFSLHNTLKPVVIGTAMTGVFILMCMAVQNTSIGVLALPWVTNIACVILAFILMFALESEVGKFDHKNMLITSGKTLIATIPAGFAAYGGMMLFTPGRKLVAIGLFLAIALVSAVLFYLASRFLHLEEGRYFDRFLKKLKRG